MHWRVLAFRDMPGKLVPWRTAKWCAQWPYRILPSTSTRAARAASKYGTFRFRMQRHRSVNWCACSLTTTFGLWNSCPTVALWSWAEKHLICLYGIWPVRRRGSKPNWRLQPQPAMRSPSAQTRRCAFRVAAMATLPFGICTISRWCDSSRVTQTERPALISVLMALDYGRVVWTTRCGLGTCVRGDNCNSMTSVLRSSRWATVQQVCVELNGGFVQRTWLMLCWTFRRMAGRGNGELSGWSFARDETGQISIAFARELRALVAVRYLWKVVRIDREGQFVERLADSLWSKYL